MKQREIKFRAYVDLKKFNVMIYDVQLGTDSTTCGCSIEQLEEAVQEAGWKLDDDYTFINESTEDKIEMSDAGCLDTGEDFVWFEKCQIMQFTGLKDKDKKDLYEGDIIQSLASTGQPIMHVIAFETETAQYIAEYKSGHSSISQSWIDEFKKEAIGNILETPSILK